MLTAGRLLVMGLWFRFRDDRGAHASGRSWRGEGVEEQAQEPLLWAGRRQREGDPGLLFDDGVGQVFHPRDRGLRAQRGPGFGTLLQSELEAWVVAQIGCIVAIFISSGNHHDPEPDDVGQDMLNLRRIAWIAQAIGEPLCQTRLAFDLAQERQPGIGTHVRAVKIKQDRLAIHG